ncbi:MAG: EAL domain-containing protein [Pseudomonadota bacterium]
MAIMGQDDTLSLTGATALDGKQPLAAGAGPLSGLRDRDETRNEAQEPTRDPAREGGHGLILLEIDDFAAIQALLGAEAATGLAFAAESRLWSLLPAGAGTWPAGQGQFAISLPEIGATQLASLSQSLRHALAQTPLTAPSGAIEVTASAGTALADHATLPHLGAAAEEALEAARNAGRGRSRFRRAARGGPAALVAEAQRAVAKGQIGAEWQPIRAISQEGAAAGDPAPTRDPRDGDDAPSITPGERMIYAEGRAQLERQDCEAVPPRAFVPALLRAGDGPALDRAMLSQALSALRAIPTLRLGLNLSPGTLSDPGWAADYRAAVARPSDGDLAITARLVLEIDAETLVADPFAAGAFAERIRLGGAALAIDRFLPDQLGGLPLDALGLDFLKIAAADAAQDPSIVARAAEIAARRDLTVVATGLDTAQSLELARRAGIAFGQGKAVRPFVLTDETEPAAHLAP